MNDKTQVNSTLNSTVINPTANSTIINSSLSGNSTVINAELSSNSLQSGVVLPGGYAIKKRLEVTSGEADLFICENTGTEYIAKMYRRPMAVKSEVIAALSEVDSPYVAKLFYSDLYNGLPFEILPYYKNGSLQGKTFSFEELKSRIIPEINEGLVALHDVGIIHKDLKPSNIMLTDSGDIAILDFGISSVQTSGNTVIVTRTGMTPEYSAPETFRNLFLEESDYYSLGITLYELFCGKTPYADMTAEEIAQYTAVQTIPLPSSMPSELKDLISALTYYDITNRRKKNNPNRRWTYTEVDNWCNGVEQPIPGEGVVSTPKFPAYTFLGQKLGSIHEIVEQFSQNWEDGKKQVFRGVLSAFLKPCDPELANRVIDAEDEAAKGKNTDVVFFGLLYRLDPEYKAFCWKGKRFDSITELGDYFLKAMSERTTVKDLLINEVMGNRLISAYVNNVCPDNKLLVEAARNIDDLEGHNKDTHSKILARSVAGYILSGKRVYNIDNQSFTNTNELVRYAKSLLDEDLLKFENFCMKLMHSKNELDVNFEAWLIATGEGSKVLKWKEGL